MDSFYRLVTESLKTNKSSLIDNFQRETASRKRQKKSYLNTLWVICITKLVTCLQIFTLTTYIDCNFTRKERATACVDEKEFDTQIFYEKKSLNTIIARKQ